MRQPHHNSGRATACLRPWQRWALRLGLATVVPLLFLCLVEGALRWAHYGRPTSFFVPARARGMLVTNPKFGWRFFPPAIARAPAPCVLPARKPEGEFRIFVLGESAALGIPERAYAFGRILEVLLRHRYPGAEFRVVNAAMTAINSHAVLPIARDCATRAPDLFILYMGNNEVIGPFGAGGVFSAGPPTLAAARARAWLESFRVGQLLSAALAGLRADGPAPGRWGGMEAFAGREVPPRGPAMNRVYDHFERNLRDILGVIGRARAKAVVCSVASNIEDCAPFASLHSAGLDEADRSLWTEAFGRGVERQQAGDCAAAAAQFARAAELDGAHADLHFHLAQCLARLGAGEEAARHFTAARDLDALHFRADSRINDIIRRVAFERPDAEVAFLDAEAAIRSETGLDRTAFYEHVHFTFEGNYALARALLEPVHQLLPAAIAARRDPQPPLLTPEQCADALGLTDWGRLRMASQMRSMTGKPPFTNQSNHAEQRALLDAECDALKTALTVEGAAERCRATLERAAAAEPDDLLRREQLALFLADRGERAAALAEWRRLLERLPDSVEWRNEAGNCLLALSDLAGALAEYQAAVKQHPFAALARVNLGAVLAQQGQLDQAIEQYRRALAIDPQSAQALFNLGVALAQTGAVDEAIAHYRACLESDPAFSRARDNLDILVAGIVREESERGNQLAQARDLAAAEQAFLRAVTHDPETLPARYNLARVLHMQEKLPDAAAQYRALLARQPDYPGASYRLGLVEMQQGHDREALAAFEAALESGEEAPGAWRLVAWIRATSVDDTLRDGKRAVACAERALAVEGRDDPRALDTLAAALAADGRFDEAVAAAQSARAGATAAGDAALAAEIVERLALYRAGQPFRSAAPLRVIHGGGARP